MHAEPRLPWDVADELRHVECRERPHELADAKPRVTQAVGMKGLHEDDRAARDASGFRQDSGGSFG